MLEEGNTELTESGGIETLDEKRVDPLVPIAPYSRMRQAFSEEGVEGSYVGQLTLINEKYGGNVSQEYRYGSKGDFIVLFKEGYLHSTEDGPLRERYGISSKDQMVYVEVVGNGNEFLANGVKTPLSKVRDEGAFAIVRQVEPTDKQRMNNWVATFKQAKETSNNISQIKQTAATS